MNKAIVCTTLSQPCQQFPCLDRDNEGYVQSCKQGRAKGVTSLQTRSCQGCYKLANKVVDKVVIFIWIELFV